ncbi:MAG: response regulator [Planctomycetota bacterium]|nr:response regulator [Planctomycetota bacterium]
MTEQLMRFFLVEDDDDHAVLVERSLKRNRVGNEVFRVADGVEALRYLRREGQYSQVERPDVILLDLKLPKLSGLEVLTEIKQDKVLRSIPVVVLTTSDAEIDRERAYFNYANSFVVKPLDFTKFRQMVEELNLYWGVWNRPPIFSESASGNTQS